MKPVEIRIELLKRGYSNVRIANELALSPRTIHNVIYGHGKSRRVASKIAKLTGISVARLFPGRYERSTRSAA